MTGASLLVKLRRSCESAWQIARGVVGETAYEQYLAHHRTAHPDTPPMSKREFWRQHVDRGDRDPGARCC